MIFNKKQPLVNHNLQTLKNTRNYNNDYIHMFIETNDKNACN